MEAKPVVEVSQPTFAELSSRLADAGHSDSLQETGDICIGNLHIASAERVSKARVAHMIDEAARRPDDPDLIYEDSQVRITSRCHGDKVHLMVLSVVNAKCETVVIPRECVALVSAGLIDCMMRDVR